MGKYTGHTENAFLQLPDTTLWGYNCHDAHWTASLVAPLLKQLRSNRQLDYYTQVVEPLSYAVLDMQERGLLLDANALSSYRNSLRRELRETDALILDRDSSGELAAPTNNSSNSIGSSKKLGRFLFETLGLRPLKKTDTGLASTDQESLYRLLRDLRKKDAAAKPVLEALFHRSRLRTIAQRYLKLDADEDGRVRARVKMWGTKTSRFAYSEPALQQFPPECRHLFVAAPGHLFVSVDYEQLEARLLAHLSGDHPSILVFKRGGDVHIENARDLFGVEQVDSLEPASRKGARNFAKTFLYGISYGGAAETMKTKLYCPCPKCVDKTPPTLSLSREAIALAGRRWFAKHEAVRKFQERTAREVAARHYYDSPLGARRYLSQPWGGDLDREVKNLPMQFGGALLMAKAQVELHKLGAPVALQVHDSFLLEVPEAEVLQWAERTREVMQRPVSELGGVSFPVSVEIGSSWGKLEPIELQ